MNIEERILDLEKQVRRLQIRIKADTGRRVFERVQGGLLQVGDFEQCDMHESDLILECALEIYRDRYRFGLMREIELGQYRTEIKMDLRDVFVLTSWRMLLCNPYHRDDTSFSVTSWPDPEFFDTVKSAEESELIYNGVISITINNLILMQNYHTGIFRSDRMGDLKSAIMTDGLIGLDPYIIFSGSKSNAIYLQLPKPIRHMDECKRVRLQLHGITVRDGAKYCVK
jgi:hypothetical protein